MPEDEKKEAKILTVADLPGESERTGPREGGSRTIDASGKPVKPKSSRATKPGTAGSDGGDR